MTAVLAISGCASGYDSVLWRLMDEQESEAYRIIGVAQRTSVGPAGFVSELERLPTYWDGRHLPSVDSELPATFYFNVHDGDVDRFGDPLVSFDVLVHSGIRPDGAPREDPGGISAGPHFGPPSVYTCYRLVVTFVAERVWRWHRSHDGGEELLDCPEELETVLADDAQYETPHEFDG